MNILPLSNWRKGLISAFPGRIAMISQRTAFPMTPQSILGCSVWDGISNRGHTQYVYTSLGSVAPVIAESGSLYDPSDSTLLDAVTLTLEEGQYLELSQCIVAE